MAKGTEHTDRRVLRTRQAVIEAAQRLLFDGGPNALTYSALAAEAGVGRATLYRHWPTIADLWSEITSLVAERPSIEFTGNLRDDLIIAMRIAEDVARSEAGRANFTAMLERAQWDNETHRFIQQFRDHDPVHQALERAVKDGTYPETEDLDFATNLLLAPLMLEAIFTRGDLAESLVEELVDRFLASTPTIAG
ncbi:MAG: TetR/AcrR family transcriptional regulator [Acidimicrobiia bacterium]